MSKQKSEKFTATVKPEKPRQQKSFVQAEGELTPSSTRGDRRRRD